MNVGWIICFHGFPKSDTPHLSTPRIQQTRGDINMNGHDNACQPITMKPWISRVCCEEAIICRWLILLICFFNHGHRISNSVKQSSKNQEEFLVVYWFELSNLIYPDSWPELSSDKSLVGPGKSLCLLVSLKSHSLLRNIPIFFAVSTFSVWFLFKHLHVLWWWNSHVWLIS